MNELIKIENHNGENMVDARLLHKKLESKQQFRNWIENRRNGYEEGLDYFTDNKIIICKNTKGRKEYE